MAGVNSILDPEVPAGAYDEFLPGALARASRQREWTPADGPLPALYLSHGAPPLFDDALWLGQLLDWSQSLPKPKAILIVSAHWEAAPLCLSAPAVGTELTRPSADASTYLASNTQFRYAARHYSP